MCGNMWLTDSHLSVTGTFRRFKHCAARFSGVRSSLTTVPGARSYIPSTDDDAVAAPQPTTDKSMEDTGQDPSKAAASPDPPAPTVTVTKSAPAATTSDPPQSDTPSPTSASAKTQSKDSSRDNSSSTSEVDDATSESQSQLSTGTSPPSSSTKNSTTREGGTGSGRASAEDQSSKASSAKVEEEDNTSHGKKNSKEEGGGAQEDKALSLPLIVGIGVASGLLGAAALGLAIWFCLRRGRRRIRSEDSSSLRSTDTIQTNNAEDGAPSAPKTFNPLNASSATHAQSFSQRGAAGQNMHETVDDVGGGLGDALGVVSSEQTQEMLHWTTTSPRPRSTGTLSPRSLTYTALSRPYPDERPPAYMSEVPPAAASSASLRSPQRHRWTARHIDHYSRPSSHRRDIPIAVYVERASLSLRDDLVKQQGLA